MDQGIDDAVVMDDKTFKSLTSKTRTDILKLLKKRNHTLSEIAEKLKISKTTAKEHLDILMEGRLIEQVPSTNKWKYYTLTKDGRKLVGEEGPKRVVITLVAFVIGMMVSIYGFSGFMGSIIGTDAVMLAEAPVPETTMAGGIERSFDAQEAEEPMMITSEAATEGETAEDYAELPPAEETMPSDEPMEQKETATNEEGGAVWDSEPGTIGIQESMEEPMVMEEYETPLLMPDYLDLMLGIVGVAIMGMAALLFLKGKKNKRSLI